MSYKLTKFLPTKKAKKKWFVILVYMSIMSLQSYTGCNKNIGLMAHSQALMSRAAFWN